MANFGPQLFEFDSQELGKLRGHRANLGAIAEIDRQLHGKAVSPEDQVQAIFQTTVASADGQKLTSADMARVSSQDLRRFAQLYLDHNPNLGKSDEPSTDVLADNTDQTKSENPVVQLHQQWTAAYRTLQENTRRVMERAGGMTSPLLQSLQRNAENSDRLGAMLASLSGLPRQLGNVVSAWDAKNEGTKIPEFGPATMPNPARETNERLAALGERFDEMRPALLEAVQMIKNLNDAAAKMVLDFAASSTKNDIFSRRSIKIAGIAAAIALLSLLVPIIYDQWKSRNQDADNRQALAPIIEAISQAGNSQSNSLEKLNFFLEHEAARDADTREALRDVLQRMLDRLSTMQASPATPPTSGTPVAPRQDK